MIKQWRLILDDKRDGFYNMAADEALLLGYRHERQPTLRIYGWERPFISLGLKQCAQEVLQAGVTVPFVRRITGGSAIVHDKEITYSLVCSSADLDLPVSVKRAYRSLCAFLLRFYARLGLSARFACETQACDLGGYGNFCFSSWQHFDIVINGKKIGGNAQRRRKNILLQQGSIPQEIDYRFISSLIVLGTCPLDSATNLNVLLGKDTDFYSLRTLLGESFAEAFSVTVRRQGYSPQETARIELLLSEKYNQESWNAHRQETGLAQQAA